MKMEIELLGLVYHAPSASEQMDRHAPLFNRQQDASLRAVQLRSNSFLPVEPAISNFPFMDLPKELRLEVYSYFATQTLEPIDSGSPERFGYWSVIRYQSLPLICRTVCDEVMDIMRSMYVKQPATVICRPDKHQNHRALQTALRLGHTVDYEKSTGVDGGYVGPEAVDVAMQTLLTKLPYGPPKNDTEFALRIRRLRCFFAHTIMRLRWDPVIRLTLIVREHPYKRFYNWYGSPTAARAVAWYTRDAPLVWHLYNKLQIDKIQPNKFVQVPTKITVVGDQRDVAFLSFSKMLKMQVYRLGEDVVCQPLGEMGYKEFPAFLVNR
jgi:hypothetical protein